jgi:ferric-dicitrate binding protein FerR (iron transport regulator)
MSSTFVPIDAATLASLNKGEESALEQIFRTRYDVLLARANERLGGSEPAAAPRLVTAVIRELWDEREALHTSTEVEGFLNEALRVRARAVHSRMAAVRRFEKSENVASHAPVAPPSVDQLWGEIAEALHKPVVDAATSARLRREHTAHDAASHIASVTAPRSWRTATIVGVLGAIAITLGFIWASRVGKEGEVQRLLTEAERTAVLTRPGLTGSLTLSDSTAVRLGADSRLVVVPRFGKEYRAAAVRGTAAFTVTPGNLVPLEARLDEVKVEASAGEFAVRDYADEPARFVRAGSDGVLVRAPEGERTLNAGETVAIDRDGTLRDATADESASAFSWMDGRLVLRDVEVAAALREFFRWYGTDIALKDSAALVRHLSIDVPLESSKEAIAAIESGGGLRFEWLGLKMTFRDAAAPPSKAKK